MQVRVRSRTINGTSRGGVSTGGSRSIRVINTTAPRSNVRGRSRSNEGRRHRTGNTVSTGITNTNTNTTEITSTNTNITNTNTKTTYIANTTKTTSNIANTSTNAANTNGISHRNDRTGLEPRPAGP